MGVSVVHHVNNKVQVPQKCTCTPIPRQRDCIPTLAFSSGGLQTAVVLSPALDTLSAQLSGRVQKVNHIAPRVFVEVIVWPGKLVGGGEGSGGPLVQDVRLG